MRTRRNTREKIRWASCLLIGAIIWLIGALAVTFYLEGRGGAVGVAECIASGVYLGILLFVMAIGNFARVRFLIALEVLYSIGVLYWSAVGVMTALLLIDQPTGLLNSAVFRVIVRPLEGFQYAAMQLTSHFVTELYWVGLFMISMMLVFLGCASIIAVGGQQRARQQQAAKRSAAVRTKPAAPRERVKAEIGRKR